VLHDDLLLSLIAMMIEPVRLASLRFVQPICTLQYFMLALKYSPEFAQARRSKFHRGLVCHNDLRDKHPLQSDRRSAAHIPHQRPY
jgi:hypothetical protein